MLPYWLLFSLVAAGAFGAGGERRDTRRQLEPMLLLIALIVILMSGLRYQVGGDWGAYARMFNRFGYLDLSSAFSVGGAEPAYGFLNWFVQRLGLGIWAVNTVCATLFTWGLVVLARNQPRPWLALVVAIPFLVIVVGMGYTRQSAALGLYMLALVAMAKERPLKAVALILAGATFHTSVLVTLPLIALSYARNRAHVAVALGAAGLIGYYTLLAPQWDRYSYGYIEQEYEARGAMVRVLMNLVPALILLAFQSRLQLNSAEKRLWRNLAIAAILSFALLYVVRSSVIVDRLALYIIPIQLFVFSRLATLLGPERAPRILITVLVVVYSAAIQFIWLNYAVHSEYWVPYRTVLSAPTG